MKADVSNREKSKALSPSRRIRQGLPEGAALRAAVLYGIGVGLALAAPAFLEMLALSWTHLGMMNVEGWQVSNIARFAAALAALVLSPRMQRAVERGWMLVILAALATLGFASGAVSMALFGPMSAMLSVCGIVAISVASTLALMMWLLLLSRHDSIVARTSVLVAVVVSMVPFVCTFETGEVANWILAFVSASCSLVLLKAAGRLNVGRVISPELTTVRPSLQILGGLVVLVAAGRLSENLIVADGSVALPLGVATIVLASVVMAIVFILFPVASYVNVARVIVSLFVASYVMAAMDWLTGGLAAFLAYTSGRLLIYSVVLGGIELASNTKGCSFRVIAGACVVQTCGALFDIVILPLGLCSTNSGSAAVMGIALSFAAIWLLNERSIGLVFSEIGKRASVGSGRIAYGDATKERFGFTPKECEICDYLMEGRSIPFIAEALVVSENTVKSHVSRMYAKTGVHTRQEFITVVRNAEMGR